MMRAPLSWCRTPDTARQPYRSLDDSPPSGALRGAPPIQPGRHLEREFPSNG